MCCFNITEYLKIVSYLQEFFGGYFIYFSDLVSVYNPAFLQKIEPHLESIVA